MLGRPWSGDRRRGDPVGLLSTRNPALDDGQQCLDLQELPSQFGPIRVVEIETGIAVDEVGQRSTSLSGRASPRACDPNRYTSRSGMTRFMASRQRAIVSRCAVRLAGRFSSRNRTRRILRVSSSHRKTGQFMNSRRRLALAAAPNEAVARVRARDGIASPMVEFLRTEPVWVHREGTKSTKGSEDPCPGICLPDPPRKGSDTGVPWE